MLFLALFISAFLAFGISTVSGGGAGLVLMPVLALLIPTDQVPAALSIGSSVSSLSRIAVFWRAIRWDVVVRFLPAALPAAALGAWLLSQFEPLYVRLVLGLFLVANLPLLFIRARPVSQAKGHVGAGVGVGVSVIGALAGLLSGFTGAVGVVFNRFYFALGLGKAQIVATRATNEILLHLLKIALYAAFGLLTWRSAMAGGVVAVAAVLASVVMKRLVPHLRESLFRHAGTAAMIAAGISMLATTIPAVMTRHGAGITYRVDPQEREMQAWWGRHRYGLAWNSRAGPVVERRLDPDRLKPRYRRMLPVMAPGVRLVAIDKFEQIDGEGLELHFTDGQHQWEQVILED